MGAHRSGAPEPSPLNCAEVQRCDVGQQTLLFAGTWYPDASETTTEIDA